MNAFDDWYNANIAPTLPHDLPGHIRQAARLPLIACWNAAIEVALANRDKQEQCDVCGDQAGDNLVSLLKQLKVGN